MQSNIDILKDILAQSDALELPSEDLDKVSRQIQTWQSIYRLLLHYSWNIHSYDWSDSYFGDRFIDFFILIFLKKSVCVYMSKIWPQVSIKLRLHGRQIAYK